MAGEKDKGNAYPLGGLNAKLKIMKRTRQLALNATSSAMPTPDVVMPTPDVVMPTPDVVMPTPDVVMPTPDLVMPTLDVVIATPDVTPPRDVATPILDVTPIQDTGSATEQGSCSSQKRRGSNKNFTLSKLTENGEKLPIVFNSRISGDGKPICENRKHWTRHLGVLVRDNFAIKKHTLKWKFLVGSELDNLWQHVIDKFDAPDINDYRDPTLRHMQHLWNRWRTDMKRRNIDVHNGDMRKIIEGNPKEIMKEDWEWLLKNHYFTDEFKKASTTNKDNRKKHKYSHHTGSKPFSQVAREMEIRDNQVPSYEDLFTETHKMKGGSLDSDAQSRFDELRELRQRNPTISNLDMAEKVFGRQNHGSIIGMGTGVLPSQLRVEESKSDLREQNNQLREVVQQLKSDNETVQINMNLMSQRLEATEKLRRAEMQYAEERRAAEMQEAEERRVAEMQQVEERRIAERAEIDLKILNERIEMEKKCKL